MAWGPAYTAETIATEMCALRKAFVENKRGYRKVLHSIMQSASGVLARLRGNTKLQDMYLRNLRKEGRDLREPLNLATEVLAEITGTGRAGRKRAWKYGKVLDVLAEAGVPPQKTAQEIRARGGIEKIVGNGERITTVRSVIDENDEAVDAKASRQIRQFVNDQEILCGIYMRSSDRDRIRVLPKGSSITVDVIRIDQPKADLKLSRIRNHPKPLQEDDEEEDGW